MHPLRLSGTRHAAALALLALTAGSSPAANGDSHTGVAAGAAVVITAEVVAVDKADRNVTLLGPRGNVVEIEVGDEVRNFDQIAVGDQVRATFLESVALYLGEPGSLPEAAGAGVAARAAEGDKPAGVLVGAYDVSASVVAIDRKRREVTLVLANGTTTTVDVDPSVKAFDRLRIGDSVHARLTRAIAIAVQPSD